MDKVEWRDVKGYCGLYEVSNIGEIKNNRGKSLTQYPHATGERYVILRDQAGNEKSRRVHKVVAEAFLRYNEGIILHRDRDRSNNKVSNLEIHNEDDGQKKNIKLDKVNCLKCEKKFMPEHKLNKICKSCKLTDTWRGYGYL